MTHLQAPLARQTAEERIRQAEQRRLTRSVHPAEFPARRGRRFLLDVLSA